MGFLADIFYFIIVIGILVFIHEFGHFIAARLTGMRTEVFAVGMGYRLFGYNRINGFSFGKLPGNIELDAHCDYRVSALPIGGYVKISGMVDESFDTEFAGEEPKEYEFRAKNTWQKTIVLSAGVIMNIILAFAIFALITYIEGESDYKTNEIGYVVNGSLADEIGLQSGDKIRAINSQEIESWFQIMEYLTFKDFGKSREILIERNGQNIIINADGDKIIQSLAAQEYFGIEPADTELKLDEIVAASPAEKAGLQANDLVLTLNNERIFSSNQFINIVKSSPNKALPIEIQREGSVYNKNVVPGENGLIGVRLSQIYNGEIITRKFGIFTSISKGVERCISTTKLFVGSIYQIFKGNISFKESIGGPIMIAKYATKSADRGLLNFLSFVALLSISLAILNILPFPALDGGHLVFVLIEGLIRKEIPTKIKMAFQQGGVILLLLLMVFVFYNDIMNAFFK